MTNSNPTGARLPVLVNLATNETFPINGPVITIGRAPDNNVVVTTDPYMSGHHAKVFWADGGWYLEDLGSSNGTTVNDELVNGKVKLTPRDVLKVGRTKFSIQ